MTRPEKPRRINFDPKVLYFKPRGIPLREIEEIELERDEVEALRLHDLKGLDQTESGNKMNVSQPTFARILNRAYKKLAVAILKGQAIKIKRETS
jgi:predicted DNA-binding protein (UPF0251 family)